MTDLLTDDRLEQRLRAACHAVIPRLMDGDRDDAAADVLATDDEVAVLHIADHGDRSVAGRRRILAVAAAVLVMAGSAGLWMAMSDNDTSSVGVPPDTANSGTTPTDSIVTVRTPTSEAPCLDEACNTFDRLPVVPGAADYYVGAESLGTPNVTLDLFDTLVRCAELTTDFSACARVEGMAGVNLVSYPTELTVDTTMRSEGSFAIGIGTTYADITPKLYADLWGVTGMGPDTQLAVVVRGHDAMRFDNEMQSTVVWQEQPGVLVWVTTPAELADQLLALAEGVRRFDGPTTIPDKTMVAGLAGAPFQAASNDANGLIAAQVAGNDCVGYLWIEQCGTDITRRTIVRSWSEGVVTVAGSTTADVMTVRVELGSGEIKTVDTIAFADRASRFYVMDSFTGVVKTVSWLDAAGNAVNSVQFGADPPDAGVGDTTAANVPVATDVGVAATTSTSLLP